MVDLHRREDSRRTTRGAGVGEAWLRKVFVETVFSPNRKPSFTPSIPSCNPQPPSTSVLPRVVPVRSHLHPVLFRGGRRLQGKDVTLDWAPATLWSPRLYIPCLLHLGFSWNMIHLRPKPCPGGSFSSLLVVVSSCAPASPVTVQTTSPQPFPLPSPYPWLSSRPAFATAASKTISTMSDPVIRTASPYIDPNIKGPSVQLLSSGHSSNLIHNKSSNSKYPNIQLSSLDNALAYTYTYTLHTTSLMTNGSSSHRLRHPSRTFQPKHLQLTRLDDLTKFTIANQTRLE